MTRSGLVLAFVLLTGCAVDSGWREVRSHEGITVQWRDYPGSAIPEFRAVTEFKGSISYAVSIMTDVASWPDWLYGCQRAEVIEMEGNTVAWVYQEINLPVVRDRQVVARSELKVNQSGQDIVITIAAAGNYCNNHTDDLCREIRAASLVQVNHLSGEFHLEQIDSEHVRLTWQQHLDPGGLIPHWLVRMMLPRIPIQTLSKLVELIQED